MSKTQDPRDHKLPGRTATPPARDRFRAPEHDRARQLMQRHLARERRIKTRMFRRSVTAAVGLFLLKAAAAWVTGSLAVLASGLDSLLDAALSGLNWYSALKADKPPDPEHPFGHGKIESLVGGLQGLVLAAVAVGIGLQALERVVEPRPVTGTGWGVAAMLVSAAVALYLSRSIRAQAQESESPIVATEQLHYSLDFISHTGVILALVLQEMTGIAYFDPFVSLLIAAFVLWQVRTILMESAQVLRGFHQVRTILMESAQDLLDRELPLEVQDEIVRVVQEHSSDVLAYHGLRTRRAGSQKIVNLHLVLCKAISFEMSHQIVDHIEQDLSDAIPQSDVTIHADPCGEYCPGEKQCPWAS